MKVLLFVDTNSEYYLAPLAADFPYEPSAALIEIPEALYEKWLMTRQAYQGVGYEIEQAMHQASYDKDGMPIDDT